MKFVRPLAASAVLVTAVATGSPAQAAQGHFSSCAQAYEAGYANIPAGHPYYSPNLDRDKDGIACDNPPKDFVPRPDNPTTTRPPAQRNRRRTTPRRPGPHRRPNRPPPGSPTWRRPAGTGRPGWQSRRVPCCCWPQEPGWRCASGAAERCGRLYARPAVTNR